MRIKGAPNRGGSYEVTNAFTAQVMDLVERGDDAETVIAGIFALIEVPAGGGAAMRKGPRRRHVEFLEDAATGLFMVAEEPSPYRDATVMTTAGELIRTAAVRLSTS